MKNLSFCSIHFYAVIVFTLLLYPLHAPAQTNPLQMDLIWPQSKMAFRQDMNAYTWLYKLKYAKSLSDKFELDFSEEYISSMLRIAHGVDKWKDDQKLNILGRYRLSPALKLSVQSYYTDFTDYA